MVVSEAPGVGSVDEPTDPAATSIGLPGMPFSEGVITNPVTGSPPSAGTTQSTAAAD